MPPAPNAAAPLLQASLSGSLWSKALLGHRAQRIEMLLLHEFYDKKFLLPDKLNNKVCGGVLGVSAGWWDRAAGATLAVPEKLLLLLLCLPI